MTQIAVPAAMATGTWPVASAEEVLSGAGHAEQGGGTGDTAHDDVAS